MWGESTDSSHRFRRGYGSVNLMIGVPLYPLRKTYEVYEWANGENCRSVIRCAEW